ICREHGKTLVEAQGDLRRGLDVVDLACGIPSLLMGQKLGQVARNVHCGMIGVNIGVPAPMALFPFAGWNESFFGDLHVQGSEGIQFYTRTKVTLTRWS
ncbi:MAG: aldehyde dehydrogenase family protein, partial [Acidobacteriota bacterium]